MAKINYEQKGEIAYLALNRPEARNAIDFEMVEGIDQVWEDFQSDDTLRVLILSSTSRDFCVGFDIQRLIELLSKEPYRWDQSSMFGEKNINPVEHGVNKPIVAALDGNVNGAGLWLALAADIRVATRDTRFGLGEARINFPVEFTGVLPRYLPAALATEMLITARTVKAERFYQLGVLHSLVERETLMVEAEGYAKDICAGSPVAISTMKELLQRGHDLTYREILDLSAQMVPPVVNSADTKEGLDAFAHKRKPIWQGK